MTTFETRVLSRIDSIEDWLVLGLAVCVAVVSTMAWLWLAVPVVHRVLRTLRSRSERKLDTLAAELDKRERELLVRRYEAT